jgi:hypothetical protein
MLLLVPFQSQHDNASGSGWRECFSSSVAMICMFHKRISSDDAYNRLRAKHGDSTAVDSHLKTCRDLGLVPAWRQNLSPAAVISEIRARRPLTLNWLHQGPIAAPRAGGHVVCCVGADADFLWVHDPAGEPDLIAGGHIRGRTGRSVKLSWRNFRRRWEMEGPGSGWGLTVAAPIQLQPRG